VTLPSDFTSFDTIQARAAERKGGEAQLAALMIKPLSKTALENIPEDRYLSAMTKCVNRAGFSWKVIEQKWPEFEEAFFGFKVDTLALLSDEQWEAYLDDRRVVRSGQKIKALKDNVSFLYNLRFSDGGIAKLIAGWPASDQIGLMKLLKKQGSRLGGNTGQFFLRTMGKDGFVLSRDVILCLQSSGLDIKPEPSSQREMKLIQEAFNEWHKQSGLNYTSLSRICSFSTGDNFVGV
jgi:3-methyladenine DNA glycosylase Tag